MPLGLGERIGTAYVRIFGDGSGIAGDVADDIDSDSNGHNNVEGAGVRLGRAFDRGFGRGFGRDSSDRVKRLTDAFDRFDDRIGSAAGRGSRNNFLNFVGSAVRGISKLLTLAPRLVATVGTEMFEAFSDAGKGGAGFLAALGTLSGALASGALSVVGLVAALTLLVTILGPVAALVSGLVAALTALAGTVLLAATAGVVALGGAIATLVLALGPLGAGIYAVAKNLDDFAPGIDKVSKAFQGMEGEVSRAIRPEIIQALSNFAPVLTGLRPLITSTADAWADFAVRVSEGLNSDTGQAFFDRMEKFLPNAVDKLTRSLENLGGGLSGAFVASLPLVNDFLRYLERITGEFDDFANSKKGREEIRTFLKQAGDSAESLGDFLVTVTDLIYDLAIAGSPTGDTIFDDLTQKAEDLIRFLNDNPDSVDNFFENGLETARSLGRIVEGIIDLFDRLDTEESREQLQDFLGVVEDLIETSSGLIDILEILSKISLITFTSFSTGLTALVEGIKGFASGGLEGAAEGVFNAFNDGIPLLTRAMESLQDPTATATELADGLVDSLNSITGAATEATYALLQQKASQSNANGSAYLLGISTRDLVRATLGYPDALGRVTDALNKATPNQKALAEEVENFIGINGEAVKAEGERIRSAERLSQVFDTLRGKVSKPLFLELQERGVEPTKRGLAELALDYKELQNKKKLQLLIDSADLPFTVQEIQKVIDRLKKIDEAKPNLSKFKNGMSAQVTEAGVIAESGGKGIADKLSAASSKARFDDKGLITSINTGVNSGTTAALHGTTVGASLSDAISRGFQGTADRLAAQAAEAVSAAIRAARARAQSDGSGGGGIRDGSNVRSVIPNIPTLGGGLQTGGFAQTSGRSTTVQFGDIITHTTDPAAVAAEITARIAAANF